MFGFVWGAKIDEKSFQKRCRKTITEKARKGGLKRSMATPGEQSLGLEGRGKGRGAPLPFGVYGGSHWVREASKRPDPLYEGSADYYSTIVL